MDFRFSDCSTLIRDLLINFVGLYFFAYVILLAENLAEQRGHKVQSFEIKNIDYVKDQVDLAVVYELPTVDKPQYLANVRMEPSDESESGASESSV